MRPPLLLSYRAPGYPPGGSPPAGLSELADGQVGIAAAVPVRPAALAGKGEPGPRTRLGVWAGLPGGHRGGADLDSRAALYVGAARGQYQRRRHGCRAARYSPIVRGRDRIRRFSSSWPHRSIIPLSSVSVATSGPGTRWLRWNQPI